MSNDIKTGEQTAVKQVSYITKKGVVFEGETFESGTIDVKSIKTPNGWNLIYSKEIDHLWVNFQCVQIVFKNGERVYIRLDSEKKHD